MQKSEKERKPNSIWKEMQDLLSEIQPGMWTVDRLDHDQNHQCTKAGVVLPYQNGLIVRNVQFYNFDQAGCAALEFTRVGGICTFLCGGFTYQTKGLQWENTNNKVSVFWSMASAQLDGFSLVGERSRGHFRTLE